MTGFVYPRISNPEMGGRGNVNFQEMKHNLAFFEQS